MKRATVTIPDDIAPALEAYLADQHPAPPLAAVIHDAVAAFLAERGYLPAKACACGSRRLASGVAARYPDWSQFPLDGVLRDLPSLGGWKGPLPGHTKCVA